MKRIILPLGIVLLFAAFLPAQQSLNYKIEQGTFNNGGNPSPTLTSTNFQMTLDSIGDGINATGLASASYGMDAGFPPEYPPPGEVLNFRWTSKTSLAWDAYPKMKYYNVYYGNLSSLSTGYGSCLAPDVEGLYLNSVPTPWTGTFYLVTTENSLEEGTMGNDSSLQRRPLPIPACE
jgi:hypothetical protein